MTTETLTLTDFLLARIAEDETKARTPLGDGQHWQNVNPSRVLAECESKRRIVEMAWHHLGEDDYAWGMEEAKRQILAVLALPYADHPDYRQEWAP